LTQPAKPKYNKRRKVVFRMGTGKQYSEEYKKEAVKLAKEIGNKAAAEELGIPKGTIGTWVSKAKAGEIDTGAGTRTPEESLSLAQQLKEANKRIKELEKKNRQLEELNEFLGEAPIFSPLTFTKYS
jgi:transposase